MTKKKKKTDMKSNEKVVDPNVTQAGAVALLQTEVEFTKIKMLKIQWSYLW